MILGRADAFVEHFDDNLICAAIDLIRQAWNAMTKPKSTDTENTITTSLFRSIKREKKNLRHLPFQVQNEVWLDEEDRDERFRIDLVFTYGRDEEIYLGWEAKRATFTDKNGRVRNNATEYTRSGMLRYVQGAYAVDLPVGGMLAYSVDGNFDRTRLLINDRLEIDAGDLCLCQPHELLPSTLMGPCADVWETLHDLVRGLFLIHHVLLC